MGGAAGHMNHLYDNPELSFDEMFSVMKSASKGRLQGVEKLDGVNVFLGYSGGVAKAARNENDIAKGGMDLRDLLAREFKAGKKMQDVYVNAVKAFEMAVKTLGEEEVSEIFGVNGEKFYNSEILHTDAKNIISYDGEVISIHRNGHKHLNPETSKVEVFDAGKIDVMLDKAVSKFEIDLSNEDMPYKFKRAAVQQLKEIGNEEALNVAVSKIKKALGDAGVSSGDTVAAYLKAKIAQSLTDIPKQNMDVATRRMVGELPWRSQEINNLPRSVKQSLSGYWKQAKPILEKAIYPIELAVHEFAVEMLKGMESAFIIDNSAEVENVRKQVKQATEEISAYIGQGLPGAEAANEILTKQLEKLRGAENIDTVAEGFVFEHDGIIYKFTGNFAPVNQIMGLWKWGRGKRVPPISQQMAAPVPDAEPEEEIKEVEGAEEGSKRIAVLPGAFKPPHSGHFDFAKWFLNPQGIEPADEVHVLISKKSRKGHSKDGRDGGGIEVTKDMSEALWSLYIKEAGLVGKIKAYVPPKEFKGPVDAAYDFMSGMRPGQTIVLGKGAKDIKDRRFDNAQAWSDKHGYQVNVEIVAAPMTEGGTDGTNMRRFIADGDFKSFSKYIPLKDPSVAWKIVRPDLEESAQSQEVAESFMPFLHGVIKEVESEKQRKWACAQLGDDFKGEKELTQKQAKEMCASKVEEVSAMSAGAVEGGAGVATKKKKPYDVWSQSGFEKELIKELNDDGPDIIELEQGLGMCRTGCPQVKSSDVPEFIKWLEANDPPIVADHTTMKPEEITPIQKQINLEKVSGMVAAKGLDALASEKPVMVSGDGYLIDGHHRWYALLDNNYSEMSVIQIGLDIESLIPIIKDWNKTSYKDTTQEKLIRRALNYLLEKQSLARS
jgi:hypothetical protein